jgi:hypothetical protein
LSIKHAHHSGLKTRNFAAIGITNGIHEGGIARFSHVPIPIISVQVWDFPLWDIDNDLGRKADIRFL